MRREARVGEKEACSWRFSDGLQKTAQHAALLFGGLKDSLEWLVRDESQFTGDDQLSFKFGE